MPKRLLVVSARQNFYLRAFDIRQGLDLLPVALSPLYINYLSNPQISVSPDQSYCILSSRSSSNNFIFFNRAADFGDVLDVGINFNGTPSCCSASNDFYALGGRGNSNLEVRRKSSNALESVNSQGIGGVSKIAFSDNGKYLTICGDNATRIYRTNDWSFLDLPEIARGCSGIVFSNDGDKVVYHNYHAPYVIVANCLNASIEYKSVNYIHAASLTDYGRMSIAKSPIGVDVFLLCLYRNPYVMTFNLPTLSFNDFTSSIDRSDTSFIVADPDPDEDALYLLHNYNGVAGGITKFHISSGLAYEDQPKMARNLLAASSNDYSACIISTTPHRIRGAVWDVNNQPVARVVRAYKRDTGVLMAQTVSDAVTGDYTLKVYDAGPYDVQFMTAPGEQLNDLFFSRTEPEPM